MFKIETHASARTSVMEVMAIEKDSDVKIGAALVITDGKLAVAAGTAKPTHVAARDAQAEDDLREHVAGLKGDYQKMNDARKAGNTMLAQEYETSARNHQADNSRLRITVQREGDARKSHQHTYIGKNNRVIVKS